MPKKDLPASSGPTDTDDKIPHILDGGHGRVIYIKSNHVDACMKAYYDLDLDGVALVSYFGYKRKDTDFLRDHLEIEVVNIIGSGIEPSGLRHLKKLRTLQYDSRVPLDLRPFKKLKNFTCEWHSKIELPDPVNVSLEKLRMWRYAPASRNLETLGPYPDLKELLLVQSNLESLSGISRFKKIDRLELNRLRNLTDIGELRHLKMEKLILDGCRKIKDWDVVLKLKGLQRLAPRNCGQPASIDKLSERLSLNP